ncbi:MAG: TIGR03960 family B12-binding radical SAM protein [candidate division WOR-3 bacterium]
MLKKLNEILPLVTKPIRYLGNEYNIFFKDSQNNPLYVCLIMPEIYEIGMSNYGLKVLYAILNRQENIIAERAYAPWIDFGEKLQANDIPLYSLESKRPLNQFNILGFSLQSELSYTNVLYILDLAKIPLLSRQRNANHPLIIAGGPCCVNPLPMADFIDCFVIGDGEEVILEITAVYRDWNKKNRFDLLQMLSNIPGVYVPLCHNRESSIIKKRMVSVLREEDAPNPPILPICEIVHDRLTVEIGRGCLRGCRFCQAGFINRPIRLRPISEIIRLAERGIRSTGWEEVSLLSLSALDYPNIQELISQLTRQMAKRRVAISLPSIRGEDFNSQIAQYLQSIKKTGLTFAPETASSRLRSFINKNIDADRIFASMTAAVNSGWRNIKLYFMIGLPNENTDDINAIINFVKQASKISHRLSIKFNLTPFIPKPHTPLQWASFEGVENLKEKMTYIKDNIRHRNIQLKWENPEVSAIQAILARGDEKICAVLFDVYRNGGIFQEWTEKFNYSQWQRSFENSQINPNGYLEQYHLDRKLPWDFIDIGVKKSFLKQEYQNAFNYQFTSNCEKSCENCHSETCQVNINESNIVGTEVIKINQANFGKYEYDLRPKDFPSNFIKERFRNSRFRLKYSVGEAFRFAGHLDIVRAIYRTLRRSELPVAYSQGFSPHPIVSFGPPLPVGVTSSGEYLDIEMIHTYSGNIIRDLNFFLPRDIKIIDARPVNKHVASLGKSCNIAQYEIKNIPWPINNNSLVPQKVLIDGIWDIDYDENKMVLNLYLRIAPKIKLFEVLSQLLQQDLLLIKQLKIERKDFYILKNGQLISPLEDT